MGTHCFINVYQVLESHDDGSEKTVDHICTIMRTCDGAQAREIAVEAGRTKVIVNGSYDGMPEYEFNGPGRFAVFLLLAISDGWQPYTTLCPEMDANSIDDDDLLLNIYVPFEGRPIFAFP